MYMNVICVYILYYMYIYISYIHISIIYIYIYVYLFYIYILYKYIYFLYTYFYYIYICIYIYIRGKHPWTSDPFKKALVLKVTLPYGCFSRHFIYFFIFTLLYSFVIDNEANLPIF